MLGALVWMLIGCGNTQSIEDEISPSSEVSKRPATTTKDKKSGVLDKKPTPNNQNIGPKGPPNMKGGQNKGPNLKGVANGSGGAFQDPSGFPPFHDWKSPEGPAISEMGGWTDALQLTKKPTGGYRPQIAISNDDLYHVVYYDRTDEGDIIRHRMSRNGTKWSPPLKVSHDSERNWGPDIVTRPDESVVVVYDHALPDFRSRGYVTVFDAIYMRTIYV